jgi:cysteinyl-tRNA synthetase
MNATLPTLTLFNTLTGQKEPLRPLEPGHVRMYVCGVTVYDYTHVGHARSFLSFDIAVRYMRYRGYRVTFVRNHTDVDDKIIRRANERGMGATELADEFIEAFDEDMARLGCVTPEVAPRVSTHMAEIIALVERLIERGHAYELEGDVYFAIDTFADYGKLSKAPLDDLRAGERVALDSRKRNPGDFALWKAAKPGEPTWESPWGPGRPGWHIECSAMSCAHLGPHFDIHGGGKDLVFPHHENEIAQSEGAWGGTYAQAWMHVGMVNVDGEKMSKSLGNFWTVRDVLTHFHPQAIRYFVLSAHYRKPIAYSTANLELASARTDYLFRTLGALQTAAAGFDPTVQADPASTADLYTALHAGMDDDFNTPVGLAVIADATRRINELLATKKLARRLDVQAQLVALLDFLADVRRIFGLLEGPVDETLLALRTLHASRMALDVDRVEALVAARTDARAARDFARADEIRQELLAMHVDLMDTPDGTTWRILAPELREGALGEAVTG